MGEYDKVKRNSLGIVIEDLKKHEVMVALPGENGEKYTYNRATRALYLIELKAKTDKAREFEEVFGKELTSLHLKIAKKVFGDQETESVYGVLINPFNKIVFAFNREFADYDRDKQEIVFRDPGDILASLIAFPEPGKKKLSFDQEEDMGRIFPKKGEFPKGYIRYSLLDND